MAILRHLASGQDYFLSPRSLIGRAPTCDIRIQETSVSGFHAEILWDGASWYVQDLGSRNGTSLGSRALARGEKAAYHTGSELILAGQVRFQLLDGAPPHLVATSQVGTNRVAEDELLCLPSDDAPEVTIFRNLEGQWFLESATGTTMIDGMTLVQAGGETWRVSTPKVVPLTLDVDRVRRLYDVTFGFEVSRDGEHVKLYLVGESLDRMLEPRVHLSLLLLLARERLADAEANSMPCSEQGWVYNGDIPRQLGIDPQQVYVWIHRARKQLARAGIRDAAAVVERRVATGQVRLGTPRITILDH